MLLGLDELLPSFVLLDRIPLDPKMLGMSSGKVLVPGKVLQAFFFASSQTMGREREIFLFQIIQLLWECFIPVSNQEHKDLDLGLHKIMEK